jgi:hypothetical protein
MSSNPQTNYKGVFEKMKFPPYEYKEYPKHIPLKQKDPETGLSYAVANNHREEMAIAASGNAAPAAIDPLAEERDQALKTIAELQAKLEATNKELAETKAKKIVEAPTGQPAKLATKVTLKESK